MCEVEQKPTYFEFVRCEKSKCKSYDINLKPFENKEKNLMNILDIEECMKATSNHHEIIF